jgi:hypothetical protein
MSRSADAEDDAAAPSSPPGTAEVDSDDKRRKLDFATALEAFGLPPEGLGSHRVTDIVARAASVLEEELASGIDAAKRVEDRFVDVPKLRDKSQDDLIQRLRRDVHDVVDILVDLLDVAVGSASGMARRAVSIRASSSESSRTSPAGVSILEVPDTVAPGESTVLAMMVHNDGEGNTDLFELMASDLVSASGGVIASANVDLDPASVQLGANERRRVAVGVRIPEGAAAGTYVGLVQAASLDHVRALLTLRVG